MAAMMDTALCLQQLFIGIHKIFPVTETDEPDEPKKMCGF